MNDSNQTDLKKYLKVVNERKYLFIGVSLLVMSVIIWGSFFIPKMYEAKCTVFIERNIINSLVKSMTFTSSLEERLGVISYAMKSRSLLLKVIKELDLDVNVENAADLEELVEHFQKKTEINLVSRRGKKTDLFTVSYRNKEPKVARDYVNKLITIYVEENLTAKREDSYEANRFLSEQIQYFKTKLNKAEDKIIEFRKEKGVFIAIGENMVVEEIKIAQNSLDKIAMQKLEFNAKMKLTEEQLSREKPYTVAMLGKMTGASINNRVMSLQNKLSNLLVKYTENYPEVIKVKGEMEPLQSQIDSGNLTDQETSEGTETEMSTQNPLYQQLKEDLSKIKIDLAALDAKEKHLHQQVETKKAYLRDIPSEKKKLADLERERANYKGINDQLVLKLGQSEVSKQMDIQDKSDTFRIVDPAILPNKPVSPDRVMIILMGLFAGIASGLGVVFLLDSMDKSIKSLDELKSLNLPVLAVVPRIVTDSDKTHSRRTDRMVYSCSIVYLMVIGVVFVKELINR